MVAGPTDKSSSPTDNPSSQPTALPAVEPTYRSCDYNFSLSINIVFSNGCNLDDGVCGEIKGFFRSIVESRFK